MLSILVNSTLLGNLLFIFIIILLEADDCYKKKKTSQIARIWLYKVLLDHRFNIT